MRIGQPQLEKQGDAPTNVAVLSGRLEASKSGWILLSVPNAIVQGLFSALDVPGAELPPSGPDGRLNAHISVMRGDELESIGGPDKITERGKRFKFQLGPVQECTPKGWSEMSKVWFVKCRSPELEALRRSYGLSSLPKNNEYEFHLTIAVRRKHVLRSNDVTKTSALITFDDLDAYSKCPHGATGECEACRQENCPHCAATQERGDGVCNSCGKDWPEGARGKLKSEILREKRKKSAHLGSAADITCKEAMSPLMTMLPIMASAANARPHVRHDETGSYDIRALIGRLASQQRELVPLNALGPVSRSRRHGFSPVSRYPKADTQQPIILDSADQVLDGRHRILKLLDQGAQNVQAIRARPEDLQAVKLSSLQELELQGWQEQSRLVAQTVEALLPHLSTLVKAADDGQPVYWLPSANEIFVGDCPGPAWISIADLSMRKAANWQGVPLAQMLGGSLVGGALGYGGGALIENLFPERMVERGRLRRTLGKGGLLLGALPGAWAWSANVANARAGGQMQGAGGALKGLFTPTDKIAPPDAVFPGQYQDEGLLSPPLIQPQPPARPTTPVLGRQMGPKVAALMRAFCQKNPVVDNERTRALKDAVKLASLDLGGVGLTAVPVDAFNNAIWNDVRRGMTAAQNPYGTKSPWGDNTQELHTPPQLGAATSGIVSGIQQMYGGTSVLSPRHLINGLLAAGTDIATARVVGSTLGALGGLTPEAQDKLQDMGLWGGLIRGTVGSMLGMQ